MKKYFLAVFMLMQILTISDSVIYSIAVKSTKGLSAFSLEIALK
jgi:hypothetical protein